MKKLHFILVPCLLVLACGELAPKEGKLNCSLDEDCPPGWVCNVEGNLKCYKSEDYFPGDAGDNTEETDGTGSTDDTSDDTGITDTGEDTGTGDDTGTTDTGEDTGTSDDTGTTDTGEDTGTGDNTDTGEDTGTGELSCQSTEYSFDFDVNGGGFTSSILAGFDLNSSIWERGTPVGNDCNSGSCWATDLGGDYAKCMGAALESPDLDLSQCFGLAQTAVLSFWHYYSFSEAMDNERYRDGGLVQFSEDGGQTWSQPTVEPSPGYDGIVNGKYDKCKVREPDFIGMNGWSGGIQDGSWTLVTIEIPPEFYTNRFRIRFLASSDNDQNGFGWIIDDVSISVP